MDNTCEAPNIMTPNFYHAAPKLIYHDNSRSLEFGSMTILTVISVTLNLVNHICLLLTVGGITYKCIAVKFKKTAMHAFLCTLGLIFFVSEGMMIRYNSNPVFRNVDPNAKNYTHIILQTVGGILGIAGTIHKMLMKKIHFNTLHGKFGLVVIILWVVNLILGILAFSVKDLKYNFGPLLSKLLHSFLGLVTFFMAIFSQYCGYESGFFRRNFSNDQTYKKLLIIIMILTILGPIEVCVDNYIQYINSP